MCNEKNEGLKYDAGKPMYALVPFSIIESVMGRTSTANYAEKQVLETAFHYQSEPTAANLENLLTKLTAMTMTIKGGGFCNYECLEGVAKVYEFGMKKYGYLNWTKFDATVENRLRFLSAFFRHFFKYLGNREATDEESGINHLHHATWNVIMLRYLTDEINEEKI